MEVNKDLQSIGLMLKYSKGGKRKAVGTWWKLLNDEFQGGNKPKTRPFWGGGKKREVGKEKWGVSGKTMITTKADLPMNWGKEKVSRARPWSTLKGAGKIFRVLKRKKREGGFWTIF